MAENGEPVSGLGGTALDPRSDIVRKGRVCFKEWQMMYLKPVLQGSYLVSDVIFENKQRIDLAILFFAKKNNKCRSFTPFLKNFYNDANQI